MSPAKKITKFKSKKGAASSGAKKQVPTTVQTAHALPSQSEVTQTQGQQLAPPLVAPNPGVSFPVQPVQNNIAQPVQHQVLQPPKPVIPGVFLPPSVGSVVPAAAGPSVHPPQFHPPPPPGVLKGRTVQGHHPAGVMKTSTQSKEDHTSDDQQLDIKIEELSDQVNIALEVADSLLDPDWTPEKIIDIVHVLVRSMNLDVVSMVLPAMNYPEPRDNVLSRGYDISPRKAVINLWLNSFDTEIGIDWKKLMDLAEDTKSELAYWVIHEGLYSIGYVPIRDGRYIYGFLFVAATEKKAQSSLTASLLDLCGSRIGLSYAQKYAKSE